MRLPKKIITLLLFGGAVYFSFEGFQKYQQTKAAYGSFEHPIHLEQTGRFLVTADVPGRSIFRPGGVLEIRIGGKQPVSLSGKGTVKIKDAHGQVALEASLEDFVVLDSPKGVYLRYSLEFETTNGGPYEITIEVTEAFQGIELTPQILTARHFVSGTAELVAFLIPFGVSGLMLIGAGALILKPSKSDRAR